MPKSMKWLGGGVLCEQGQKPKRQHVMQGMLNQMLWPSVYAATISSTGKQAAFSWTCINTRGGGHMTSILLRNTENSGGVIASLSLSLISLKLSDLSQALSLSLSVSLSLSQTLSLSLSLSSSLSLYLSSSLSLSLSLSLSVMCMCCIVFNLCGI